MREVAWKVRNKLVERMAKWGGRFLYKSHVLWLNDLTWTRPYMAYLEGDRRPKEGLGDDRILDRRFTLAQFATSVRDLPGSTAECGVLHGVGSGIICKTLEGTYQPDSRHYGFDSFEGLPAPSALDRTKWGQWWSRGALRGSEEVTRKRLAGLKQCRLVKGWIPECFECASDDRFRLVHIDVDLYQATLDSLSFFYPRLVEHGVILFDDHGLMSCPGARKAAEEFFSDKPDALVELATGQALVIRRGAA